MIVFLDFEASSLGKHGFPIEVGWAAEDGTSEGHLIRPAPGWQEWSKAAEEVHGMALAHLPREGEPHDAVAARMVEALSGHELYASAPSWDGHWLSLLLRASGFTRRTLRLRGTDEAHRSAATGILHSAGIPADEQPALVEEIIVAARDALDAIAPAHRAVDDARRELHLWQEVRRRAELLRAR
ncbi:MAG TPA: transcriptional regulator [Rhodopila sp.]|nr:transcriptional regulator [Rhodopila sp.]